MRSASRPAQPEPATAELRGWEARWTAARELLTNAVMPVADHYLRELDRIEARIPVTTAYHCLRCARDVPADEVHEAEWMPGRVGTFHTCGDYAHPGGWNG